MSTIKRIVNNQMIINTTKLVITIISLPIITYLIRLYLMFLYKFGIYLGIFLRNLYKFVF